MKKKCNQVYRVCVGLLLVVMLCVVITTPVSMAQNAVAAPTAPNALPSSPAALFLNVGKADCILVFLGDQTYMIDTGTKDSAPAILRAMDAYGVSTLAGIFLTHMDKDHVGGLKPLLKSDITVKHLYTPKIHIEKSDADHPVYEASQKHEIPMTWLSAGDIIDIAKGVRFTVLGPISLVPENDNNNSLVMVLDTPQGNMLFTGDMEFVQEDELLRAGVIPKATVLKVAHHGEDDTSSNALIGTVRPQWAVICTDSQEEKDTPDPKVIRLLWAVKSGVAVTQNATCGILITLKDGQANAEAINYQ